MWSLFEEVDQRLANTREFGSSKRYAGIFEPSSASVIVDKNVFGKCARASAFDLLGLRKPITSVRANWKFEFGGNFEQTFIEMMKRAGLFHSDHVKMAFPFGPDEKYQISGEIDVIGKNGSPFIVELKTISGRIAESQCVTGYDRPPQYRNGYTINPMASAPKIEHLIQVMLYQYYGSVVLPKQSDLELDHSRICYLSISSMKHSEYILRLVERGGLHFPKLWKLMKSDDSYFEQEIELLPFSVEDIFSRYIYIAKHIENDLVPPRDYSPQYTDEEISDRLARGILSKTKANNMRNGTIPACDWQCSYCQYKQLCEELPSGAFKIDYMEELNGIKG